MDSENSFSGESSSSSETSSGSSDADEEVTEPIRILGHTMELPQELCEDYSVFREFFSIKTWEALDENQKDQLTDLLPKFIENEDEEVEKTIKMLFEHEPFHFSSPLTEFYNNLRHGNYRPDIAKMRKFLRKARTKQQKHKIKSYYAKLLPEVLISRERLLAAVKGAPPGPAPRLPPLPPKKSSKNNYKPLYLRAKQRYFEELAAIQSEVGGEESEDENYPDGPPEQFRNKKKPVPSVENSENNVSGTLSGPNQPVQTSLECLKNILIAHRARRQYRENHPELNVSGITLEDIKQRVALVNGSKKFMFGSQKLGVPIHKLKRNTRKDTMFKHTKPYTKALKKTKADNCADSVDDKQLLPNIKIKCEQDETDSESSSFVDPVMSPNRSIKKVMDYDMMQDSVDVKHNISRTSYTDSKLDIAMKQDIADASSQNMSRIVQPVPIKLEDLDGIDMMALPVELADDSGEVIQVDTSTETVDESIVDPDESLTETTHANFLSLVRALFPARVAHRATKQQLHARCTAVMKSPIAPLNTWYNLSDDWCAELDSALDFLAGERGTHPEDFVPYLQYIPETQTYQWIGAGRDCDAILGRICERWLRAVSPAQPTSDAPPPRYPTTWSMRAPTTTEVAEFRTQERKRFLSAAKPFTYIQHGYRSVVGPCGRAWGGWGGGTGAALVAVGRPRHATFAALLRDALARLPNGRGTRHDVLTLLKMSQWIAPCSDQALLGAVSAALDKFHSAKRDPIVKYDQRTAIWTYLHRNRSEEDWVKVTTKGRGKAAIVAPHPLPPPVSVPSVQPAAPTSVSTTVPSSAAAPTPLPASMRDLSPLSPSQTVDLEVGTVEEVVDASDSDVDVDDTNASSSEPQLSFAQLLMQATQHTKQPQIPPTNKPKGKLVATPAPKPKPTIITKQAIQSVKQGTSSKQATLMSQSVKQATLMAQSIKQATVMTQAKAAAMPVKTIPQSAKSNAPQTPKATSSPKQTTIVPPLAKQITVQTKPTNMPKSTKQSNLSQSAKSVVSHSLMSLNVSSQISASNAAQLSKSLPSLVTPPQKSQLIKQRPLQKAETGQVSVSVTVPTSQATTVIQSSATTIPTVSQNLNKVPQGTRSLLIRPPTVQTTVTAASTPTTQTAVSRRGVVRVLSPATPSSGKSLISPRALLQSGTATTKKRSTAPLTSSVATVAHSTASVTTVVSSVPTIVTSSVATRTVQLAGGRTVQLAANQTVHLPGGQAVQLTPGHTLQLSSLQTHSVRLPSGQTVQLASPQAIQAVKMSTANVKNLSPRGQQSSPAVKNPTSQSALQIPVSTVQLSGQTVQIGGQTVQLAGQSVQLTGHTVKLPSGQSVQVASQSVIPSQSVQLPSGQTVQLASGNVQTVQIPGQSVQVASAQSVQLGGSQTVQLTGQTVQLAGGQTVQLPSGQTLQLSSGQTVQLSSGQTLQLASGQTVHLANQTKNITQVVRNQTSVEKSPSAQPIVAKLLTNAQGQMISLEGMVGSSRSVQAVTSVGGGSGGVVPRAGLRVVSPATRLARPLLLTSAKPLHNIILQHSDGSAIRVTSSGGSTSSQTLVLSNISSQATTTSSSSAPVLKLQQVNPLQQVKLAQGIKIQQAGTSATVPTSSGVRSVLMDGQQLKLVGGRHVLARILRPAHPPP